MAPGNGGSPQPSKRRKVAESCKVCRAKKTRCDGQRPNCSPCITKGATCEYNDTTIPVPAITLSDIETRLERLERHASTTATQSTAEIITPRSLAAPLEQPLHPTGARFVDSPPNPRVTDLDPAKEQLFTDHPTTQFMQDITQLVNIQSTAQLHASLWGQTDAWPVETDTSSMVVPKRAIADDLLDCYEIHVYPVFPILHMPTFRESYQCLWEPKETHQFDTVAREATFYATLNIVFALGCINNSKVEPQLKLRTADSFYRRTRALLPLDALDVPTLEAVQCLLLTTNYLSFTKYSNRCSNTLAVAIRNALTLGLHRDAESSSANQLKREMNRRVWYHCLTMERLFNSLFGRETMIEPHSTTPLPEKIDDEFLQEDGAGTQPAGVPSTLDAFIATIHIFEVIEGARKINYGSFTRGLRLPELTEVLQLNEKINHIEDNLPSHLKRDDDAKPNTPREQMLKLQAEAVMTRILHLRLVLLRPNVLATARHTLAAPVSSQPLSRTEITLRTEVSTLCVQAAVSAVNKIHDNLHSASRIISSNAVFVTLSAATVIVAASLLPELDVRVEGGLNPYDEVIAKAFQVLEEHRWQIEGAPRAKAQLEKFIETVNQARRRRNCGAVAQDFNSASQIGSGQLSGIDDAIDLPDFSDPLWDFQWDGSATYSMPGSVF